MKCIPVALFQVTTGLGNPSALHSTAASEPWANALSVGSKIHLGGTKSEMSVIDYLVLQAKNWSFHANNEIWYKIT